MQPQLVTLQGNKPCQYDTEDTYGLSGEDLKSIPSVRAARILNQWNRLTPRQQKIALQLYPELYGAWPLIAKIGAGVAKVGGKVIKGIAKKVRERRQEKNSQKEKRIQAQIEAEKIRFEQERLEAEKKKNNSLLLTAIPAAIGILSLLKK